MKKQVLIFFTILLLFFCIGCETVQTAGGTVIELQSPEVTPDIIPNNTEQIIPSATPEATLFVPTPSPSDSGMIQQIVRIVMQNGIEGEVDEEFVAELNETNVVVEAVFPGSFTGAYQKEFLIVLKPDDSIPIPHVLGLYHRYFAVLDSSLQKVLIKARCFNPDEGAYYIYRKTAKSYVFFSGAVVYQGDAERCGGIYDVNGWKRIWPENDAFWQDHAVAVNNGNIRVMKKSVHGWKFEYSLYIYDNGLIRKGEEDY